MKNNFIVEILEDSELFRVKIQSNFLGHEVPLKYETLIENVTEAILREVYLDAITEWEYNYGLGKYPHTGKLTFDQMRMDMRIHNLNFHNWVYTPPPFFRKALPQQTPLRAIEPYFYNMLEEIDLARFRNYPKRFFERYVWFGNRFVNPRPVVELPSLQALCLRRMSIANYAGSDRFGPICESATNQLFPLKIPILLSKYGKNVHKGLNDPFLRKSLNMGIHLLYSVMGTRKYFGTYKFKYSEDRMVQMPFPGDSSAGLRKGRNKIVKYETEDVKLCVNGTKKIMAPYSFAAVDNYIRKIQSGDTPPPPQRYWKLAFKYEVTDMMWKFGQKKIDAQNKCREFFLSHQTDFIIMTIVHGFRSLVERGNTIKVGFKFWHGGAHNFAAELGYPREDIIYNTGDIKGQDYTTHHFCLRLFSYTSLLYIDKESEDYELYLYLLEHCADYIVAKMVNMFANMWRWIVGTMPSGSYVTTTGNSFILAMYFWGYICSVHLRNPKAKLLIKSGKFYVVGNYFIRFPVYGDNHVMAHCKSSAQYISYSSFIKYLEALSIVIHDIQENVPLISVPDSNGNLQIQGIVFLKRYLIAVQTPAGKYIVPYKRYIDVAAKIVFGNSMRVNNYDYMLALCGMAFDMTGTNRVVHNMLVHLYTGMVQKIKNENMMPYTEYMRSLTIEQNENMTRKLSRKLAIPIEDFFSFPTLENLLSRHKYDESKFNYRRVPNKEGMSWDDDVAGHTYRNRHTAN